MRLGNMDVFSVLWSSYWTKIIHISPVLLKTYPSTQGTYFQMYVYFGPSPWILTHDWLSPYLSKTPLDFITNGGRTLWFTPLPMEAGCNSSAPALGADALLQLPADCRCTEVLCTSLNLAWQWCCLLGKKTHPAWLHCSSHHEGDGEPCWPSALLINRSQS